MDGQFLLYGQKGTGSAAIEAALILAGAPYAVRDIPHAELLKGEFNPAAQVPALRLPSGETITESAAILLYIAEAFPEAKLAPPAGDPARAAFLRWMVFVSTAIYAHYWALDFPVRLIADPAPHEAIKAALEKRIADCWGMMDAAITPGAYLLGDTLTVLDLYVTVVSRWTPREALHAQIAPRIGAVARRVEADPRLAELFATRFPLKDDH